MSLNKTKTTTLILVASALFCSCSSDKSSADSATALSGEETPFHADNDIAMIVRSLMDAISVGEPLDSAQYTFTGVLTDGGGRPIYTDIQGAPGTWEVRIVHNDRALLRNLHPGDLMPRALIKYLTDNTDLDDTNKVKEHSTDERIDVDCYSFKGCLIRFETRPALTTGGIESPLMTIDISSEQSVNVGK